MLQVEFEPMLLVFERAKTIHALDRVATVIGVMHHILYLNNLSTNQLIQHSTRSLGHCLMFVLAAFISEFYLG
jgi:hypothetical protein